MLRAATIIARLRRSLSPILPRAWLRPAPEGTLGPGPRRRSSAVIEIDPDAPASSWVVWEISPPRRARRQRGSEQREG
jgi:hypothetical protein